MIYIILQDESLKQEIQFQQTKMNKIGLTNQPVVTILKFIYTVKL